MTLAARMLRKEELNQYQRREAKAPGHAGSQGLCQLWAGETAGQGKGGNTLQRWCLAVGHLFKDLLRLHCFTFISYTHSSLFYQDWELLFISSLLGSQVSGIAALLPLLQEKSLWRKSSVAAWLAYICFAPLAFGKNLVLCRYGAEVRSDYSDR